MNFRLIICFTALSICLLLGCNQRHKVDGEIIDGIKFYYYDNGEIKAKLPIDKDGKKQGIAEYFYEDGILQQSAMFVNDTLDGEMRNYFPSGELEIISPYVNGKFQGRSVEFFRNGKIKAEGLYVQGNKQGVFVTYYESGSKQGEYTYQNGNRIAYIEYDETGGVKEQSITIELQTDRTEFIVNKPVLISVKIGNRGPTTDSTKAYIKIISLQDSIVEPVSLQNNEYAFEFTPKYSGNYSIKAGATEWANSARNVVFYAFDSTQIFVQQR